jgi:hypothetical protein
MDKRDGLLRWQLALYPGNHRNRRNLVLHILTVPLFMAGTVALALAWRWHWLAAAGPAAMLAAMALQGRGHAREHEAPVPFAGPLDVVQRIFVEQWVTFPRFVASGGFARAWRGE